MRLKPTLLVVAGLVAAAAVSGCVGKYQSDFPIVVVNRAANSIQVLANGNEIGEVASGQTGSFSLKLSETNSNEFANGVAPTPQAQVTFSAKDLKTGAVSTPQPMTVSANSPTYVTFSVADFPPSGPTVARFTFSPATPGLNEVVSFSASTSTVSGGTFTWDFGDGTTGSGVAITHQYPRAATFTVTLTVTSNTGVVSIASRALTVSTTLPPNVAMFTISPTVPAVNQDVFFNASTSNVSGATFAWDFGDGGTGSGASASHRYVRSGTYTVTLRVSNNVGQSAAASRTVSVAATSPQVVASFTFSPTTPGINQQVFFNASASTPSNATLTWNFGDGSTGSGVLPTHRYAQAGIHVVTLTVTNDVGQSSTTARAVPVSGTSAQIVASFTFSPTTPDVNQDVFFNGSTSTASNPTFSWDFGDGTSGSGVSPLHRFSRAGTYTVTMTVTNDAGQSATTTRTITVTTTTIVADFTFSPTDPAIARGTNTVIFDATPSSAGATTWTWDFGDGTAAGSGQRLSHTFTRQGTWVVRLTVTDSAGRAATATKNVTVSP